VGSIPPAGTNLLQTRKAWLENAAHQNQNTSPGTAGRTSSTSTSGMRFILPVSKEAIAVRRSQFCCANLQTFLAFHVFREKTFTTNTVKPEGSASGNKLAIFAVYAASGSA
jgi:hypothetical protein